MEILQETPSGDFIIYTDLETRQKLGVYSLETIMSYLAYTAGIGRPPKLYNDFVRNTKLYHPDISNDDLKNILRVNQEYIRAEVIPLYEAQVASKLNEALSAPEKIEVIIDTTPLVIPEIVPTFAATLQTMNHAREIETIACFLAQNTQENNPAWLSIIAPPSSGKTFDLKICTHNDYALLTDEITENALAAARPNMETDLCTDVFTQLHGRTLVINDMGSIFGDDLKKTSKFIGTLTAAFGGKFRKSGPVETREYITQMGVILAMTPQIFAQNIQSLNKFGNRFLSMTYFNGNDVIYDDDEYEIEFDESIKWNIALALKRDWKIPFGPGVQKRVKNFALQVSHLRSFMFAKSKHSLDGASRL